MTTTHNRLIKLAFAAMAMAIFTACGSTQTLYVGSSLQPCHGVAPMECMQVKTSPDGQYQHFYSQIKGFDFEPGYQYVLKVRTKQLENVPADASSIAYSLVRVKSKTADPLGALAGEWTVATINGQRYNPSPSLVLNLAEGKFSGKAFCNRYFGSMTVANDSLRFGNAASTMMACADVPDDSILFRALDSVATYQVDNGVLRLLDKEGKTVVECRRATK